jgi:uncharacterized protein YacL
MRTEIFFRFLFLILFGLWGWWLGEGKWLPAYCFIGALLGFLIAPYLSTRPVAWIANKISQISTPTLLAGVLGLLIALLLTALLTLPLSLIPGIYGRILPLIVGFLLCYAIVSLTLSRGSEFFHFFSFLANPPKEGVEGFPLLVDTSVLIDGRIADIGATGFLLGQMVIPSFVLRELQHIADSTDPLRRRRGRRGLEILSRLRSEAKVPIRIEEIELGEGEEADSVLIKLAKNWRCPILTTDFNLNRVAEVQGIKVLNLNNLASALKPAVMPGEEMEIMLIQEGKEAGQGVGFLDDGTMVVVEGGKRYLNNKVNITITRVLQTAMGRMIFAQIKEVE